MWNNTHQIIKLKYIFLCILVYLPIFPSYADAEIRLLEQTPQSVLLELTLPEPVISEKQLSGYTYQTITIPGMEQGKIPTKGTFLAVPRNSQIEIEIIESESKILSNILLAPVEGPSQVDRFQPANPVEIAMTGAIREQQVAQIQFFGVQLNTVQKTVKLYKRLRVKVNFINNSTRSKMPTVVEDSPAFDRMLQQLLLNDTSANRVLRSTVTTREDCPSPLPASLKLTIDKTGVYALSYDDFLALGLDVSVLDSSMIQMTHQGKPVPIFIAGEEDGVFGPGDMMFFYAQAAKTPYTRSNIYWLSLKLDGGAARLNFRMATPNANDPPLTTFKQTVHFEENKKYSAKWPKGVEKEHLFWFEVKGGESSQNTFSLPPPIQSSSDATIRVMMHGKKADPLHNPDHQTKVSINDVEIFDEQWDGQVEFLQEITTPQSNLHKGENTFTLVSVKNPDISGDIVYLNWFEIEYTATTTAVEDQLTFEAVGEGATLFTIKGFTQPNVLVLDVTNPLDIVPLLDVRVSADGEGGHQVQYSDNLDGNKTFYAFSIGAENLLQPTAIDIDVPMIRLQSACNQADYFIIHHDSFNVDAFKSLVSARGLQVMTVAISEIYDEFNHGLPSPQAIKDFLTYAYENYTQPRPAYVALVGDANQDYLNDLGFGINYVPTHLFYTSESGATGTDNWFVSISGDDHLPDMFLGRIPVRTQAELDAVVNKLTVYPQTALDGWERNVLVVTDDNDRSNENFDEIATKLIEKSYFVDYNTKLFDLNRYDGTDKLQVLAAKPDLIQELNMGNLLTTYIGHGATSNWTGEPLFHSADVTSLNNTDKFTFLVTLNCLNGRFAYYEMDWMGNNDSLAEAFLKADNKGAIAVFAPTGLGYTFEHNRLAEELFKRLFQDKETELGPLTTAAKISARISKDSVEMFTLFGDPSLSLRLE
ncbi:hypothetical protein PN36_03535 [Candidatus Thiomargarita nelsonii]|uniref:Uncharacterized protein n=1 Tax=Candidatus Thiomargarita nelsonii TaxID=1003181 RepID=A0A4E0QS10_9GAMM|nr:hypothetical protein PN36_03535 [Candidatus Thiomargarita nelsonii]